MFYDEEKLSVQYLGQSGYTATCLIAIDAILNSGSLPDVATIVSHNRGNQQEDHLFLFWNWGYSPLVVVPSGFASGYPGEGPKGFSIAICMIREKHIPVRNVYISQNEFDKIDCGRITNIDDPIFSRIKLNSEIATFPWPLWVNPQDEELLERGQLWRQYYWRNPKTDLITEALADVDLYCPEAGKRLRIALRKLEIEETVEWQATGIHIRDAWIELASKICREKHIDTNNLLPDDVTGRLSKLGLAEQLKRLAKSTFDLSLKNQHDRRILQCVAKTCIITAAFSMQSVLEIVNRPKTK